MNYWNSPITLDVKGNEKEKASAHVEYCSTFIVSVEDRF
jgi:hypothetical protein